MTIVIRLFTVKLNLLVKIILIQTVD